ncbi:MAG: hypothetical protein EOO36_09635 [Cytophagaceae bacterium]|nr:MAG: hypothetical protein EOO36_09635 [Cytophagaceae bacterium]
MKQTLLAGLLVMVAAAQLPARGAELGWVAASSGDQLAARSARPTGDTLAGQDTAKLNQARGAQLTIASAHPRFQPWPAAKPEAELPDRQPAGVLNEAGEFDLEAANLPATLAITLRRPAAPLGRHTYRTRRVRTGLFTSRREAVEILTCTYAGPLVLAQLPATAAAPVQLLAGPGYDQAVALRPLALTQKAVLHLCGPHAPQVLAYARLYNLHFQQAADVARLLDFYNRIAVVK